MPDSYRETLEALRSDCRLRKIPDSAPGWMIDFTSNDYLGIAADTTFQRSFLAGTAGQQALPALSSVASRLLATRQNDYAALEVEIGGAYGRRALLFNSGYHANTGCLAALAGKNSLIVSDKLVHASIIDGIKLSGASFKRFRHNDMAALERLLAENAGKYERIWVVVESIYSMDGDKAPLLEIVEMKRRYPGVMLYVDEAHGVGVCGATGLGLCEELGIMNEVDLLVGTFGKALASVGAYAVTNELLHDYLVNTARSLIFSTALPPLNVAYSLETFRRMRGMRREREHLARLGRMLREGIEEISGEKNPSESQIVPWITGDSRKAVEYAAALREAGFLAMPIRRPTVAAGTERIRFSLSADKSLQDVERLLDACRKLVAK